MQGDGDEAHRLLQMGLKWGNAGDSGLIISYLVNIAKVAVTISAIEVAQQYHVMDAQQWEAIDQVMETLDFPLALLSTLENEQAFGHRSVLRQVSDPTSSDEMNFGMRTVYRIAGAGFRSISLRSWRQTLAAYDQALPLIQSLVESPKGRPSNIDHLLLNTDAPSVQLDALLTPITKFWKNAMRMQALVARTRLAITLELYYLKHNEYPTSIEALQLAEIISLDPLTNAPIPYELDQKVGFTLSAPPSKSPQEERSHRMFLWRVLPTPPPFPIQPSQQAL